MEHKLHHRWTPPLQKKRKDQYFCGRKLGVWGPRDDTGGRGLRAKNNNTQISKSTDDIETTKVISNNKKEKKSTAAVNGYPGQADPEIFIK